MKHSIKIILCVPILLSVFTFSNAQQVKPDRYANRRVFVLLFTPGKNWEQGKPMSQQNLDEHRAYYQQLLEKDKVIIGGGFIELNEGMSILKVKNRGEADSVVINDPAVRSGIFNIQVKPFFAVFRERNEQALDLNGLVFKR